jgi:hypothetical protein
MFPRNKRLLSSYVLLVHEYILWLDFCLKSFFLISPNIFFCQLFVCFIYTLLFLYVCHFISNSMFLEIKFRNWSDWCSDSTLGWNNSRVSLCLDVPVSMRMQELYLQVDRDCSFANTKCLYHLRACLWVLYKVCNWNVIHNVESLSVKPKCISKYYIHRCTHARTYLHGNENSRHPFLKHALLVKKVH